MNRLLVLGLATALTLLVAARADQPDPEPPMQDGVALMRGTWEVKTIVFGGMKVPANINQQKITMKFERNSLTSTSNGMTKKGSWKIDPRKNPKTLDLISKDDNKTGPCIYKLDGDELTIAFAQPGQARPKDFTTLAMTLARIKKK